MTPSERASLQASHSFQADGDGFISAKDLESVLVAGPRRAQTAAAILQSASPDARGRVDFGAFRRAIGDDEGNSKSHS